MPRRPSRNRLCAVCICLSFVFSLCVLIGKSKGIPFVGQEREWAIGIYTGSSPHSLSSPQGISNPVITKADITDVNAKFVADPFVVHIGPVWHMFFEVYDSDSNRGVIGLAESDDGITWTYAKVVLAESFHLSYPCIVKWKNDYYMVPESHEANELRIYKADNFPHDWSLYARPLSGRFDDPTLVRDKNKWWLFAETNPDKENTLCLYYADTLKGPWIEHPASPVVQQNPTIARPAGRPVKVADRIIRFAQDSTPTYGSQVIALEILRLTTTHYEERRMSKNPVITAAGHGWNADGMHHIDCLKISDKHWRGYVDGYEKRLVFGWQY